MCSCYLLVTFGEGKGGKRLLPGCSAGTQLPICHRTGSRGVGSGCGGGSFHAFWPPEPAKKDRKMPGNINHVKCQRLAGDGEGEVGAGGCGSHGRVCSLGLQPSVSKCTLIYIRRSQPHLLMHQQIWALLLPLSPQHSSAHLGCWDRAGRSTGCLRDGVLAHPRDRDAQLGVHTQQTQPIPWTHESLQPAQNSSSGCRPGMLTAAGQHTCCRFFGSCHLFEPRQDLGDH